MDGARRRLAAVTVVLAAVAVVLAALASGCGGQSDRQRAASLAAWARKAEAICKKAEARIYVRGEPADLFGLGPLVADDAQELRAAVEGIAGLPLPSGAEARARAAVRAMRAIEPHILALEQAAARSDTGALPAAAKQLRGAVEAAGGPVRAAGVRRCGDRTQAIALADGVLAPVFAQGFADFQRSFVRRLGRERARHSADSLADVSRYFTGVSDLLAKARTDFEGLEAPARAEGLDSLYGAALTAMSGFAATAADKLEGRRTIDASTLVGLDRQFRRLAREERRSFKALVVATGARPVPESPDEPADQEA